MIQFEMDMAFHENVTRQPGIFSGWKDNVKAASAKILVIQTKRKWKIGRDIEMRLIEQRKPSKIELKKKSTTTNIDNFIWEFKLHNLDVVTTNHVLTIVNSTSFTSSLREQFLKDEVLKDYLHDLKLSIPPNVTRIAGVFF